VAKKVSNKKIVEKLREILDEECDEGSKKVKDWPWLLMRLVWALGYKVNFHLEDKK